MGIHRNMGDDNKHEPRKDAAGMGGRGVLDCGLVGYRGHRLRCVILRRDGLRTAREDGLTLEVHAL